MTSIEPTDRRETSAPAVVLRLRPTAPNPVDTSQPVRPGWLADRETATSAARLATRRGWYRTKRWLVVGPEIAAWLVVYAPRGFGRIVAKLARYLYDFDTAELRHHHSGRQETQEYVRAHQVRRANLRARWMVAGTLALLLAAPVLAFVSPLGLAILVGIATVTWVVKIIPGRSLTEVVVGVAAGLALGGATWWFVPRWLADAPRPEWWHLTALAVVVVFALGWIGKPRGKSLVPNTTLPAGIVEPLRAPMVTEALCTLGNAKMREPDDIRLLTDPHRVGLGVQLDLELPAGVPASFVVGKREEFAAALRRELGCVWPAVGTRHPGHLVVFVSDEAMAKGRQKPWPLLRSDGIDLFEPQPAFTDQRGAWRTITLAYSSMVIGAVPRMGKTFVVRQLLLLAGLDPRVKVYCIDGKGTGDLAACRLFAHFYSVGDEPEELDRVVQAMRDLRDEMRRRTKVIRDLDADVARENKVTSALANRRGLEPIVVGIDETQVFFEDAPDKVAKELVSLVTDLVKRGPALGIQVILATQNVTANTIPSSIADNAVLRFCLKIEGQNQNNRILGVGARDRGIDAGMFDVEDKGLGYLKADGANAEIVRSVFGLDAVESEKLAARARRIREAKGRLTGEAAGEDAEQEQQQVDFLVDCRTAIGTAKAALLPELLDRLGAVNGHWAELDVDALGSMLGQAGVKRGTVWSTHAKRTGYGVKAEWLDVAATADEDTAGDVIDLSEHRQT